ncbi:hypothetical protein C7M84_013116 [Penaeus vannamei]|uniref:Uncharacterized protein n=1 Tax=Penaeus vannamei TaxID=6689 RepID=A0A423SXA9_PENVA|nr:hypothetical protein C7M84_013116 [Penaeus vannamei]
MLLRLAQEQAQGSLTRRPRGEAKRQRHQKKQPSPETSNSQDMKSSKSLPLLLFLLLLLPLLFHFLLSIFLFLLPSPPFPFLSSPSLSPSLSSSFSISFSFFSSPISFSLSSFFFFFSSIPLFLFIFSPISSSLIFFFPSLLFPSLSLSFPFSSSLFTCPCFFLRPFSLPLSILFFAFDLLPRFSNPSPSRFFLFLLAFVPLLNIVLPLFFDIPPSFFLSLFLLSQSLSLPPFLFLLAQSLSLPLLLFLLALPPLSVAFPPSSPFPPRPYLSPSPVPPPLRPLLQSHVAASPSVFLKARLVYPRRSICYRYLSFPFYSLRMAGSILRYSLKLRLNHFTAIVTRFSIKKQRKQLQRRFNLKGFKREGAARIRDTRKLTWLVPRPGASVARNKGKVAAACATSSPNSIQRSFPAYKRPIAFNPHSRVPPPHPRAWLMHAPPLHLRSRRSSRREGEGGSSTCATMTCELVGARAREKGAPAFSRACSRYRALAHPPRR